MSAPYLNRTPGGLPGTHAARPTATPTATASPPRSPMGLATVDPAFCARFPAMATRPKRPPVDPASTLFGAAAQKRSAAAGGAPLADRMRPHVLAEVVGQKRLLAPGSLLTQAIEA